MKSGITLFFLLLGFSIGDVRAEEPGKFETFFSEFEALNNRFDIAVADRYSDDAKITGIRVQPDGTEKTTVFDGKKWKQLIRDLMELAKERGDTSKYSNVKVTADGDTAKITASRYSALKCYQDNDYYLVVKAANEERMEIIEEFSKAPQQSACENAPKDDDLALILRATVLAVSKKLPVMLDSDTKLEKISSEGKVLSYDYELVNFLSTEVDKAGLNAGLTTALVKQACSTPGLKSIMEKGGTLSYRYNGKDKLPLTEVRIDIKNCP